MAKLPTEQIIRYESTDGLHVKGFLVGELVRCKECKYFDFGGDAPDLCRYSCRDNCYVTESDYCSCGKRREDGE